MLLGRLRVGFGAADTEGAPSPIARVLSWLGRPEASPREVVGERVRAGLQACGLEVEWSGAGGEVMEVLIPPAHQPSGRTRHRHYTVETSAPSDPGALGSLMQACAIAVERVDTGMRARWMTRVEIEECTTGVVTTGMVARTPEPGGLRCPELFGQGGAGRIELGLPVVHPFRIHELAAQLGCTERGALAVALGVDDVDGVPCWELAARPGLAPLFLSCVPVLPLAQRDPETPTGKDLQTLYRTLLQSARFVESRSGDAVSRREYANQLVTLAALFDNAGAPEAWGRAPDWTTSLHDVLVRCCRGSSVLGSAPTGWLSAFLAGAPMVDALRDHAHVDSTPWPAA